jgi:hypothetical protein
MPASACSFCVRSTHFVGVVCRYLINVQLCFSSEFVTILQDVSIILFIHFFWSCFIGFFFLMSSSRFLFFYLQGLANRSMVALIMRASIVVCLLSIGSTLETSIFLYWALPWWTAVPSQSIYFISKICIIPVGLNF